MVTHYPEFVKGLERETFHRGKYLSIDNILFLMYYSVMKTITFKKAAIQEVAGRPFREILKELMKSKNYNQLFLARKMGIRQSQVSNWLHGKSLPSYESTMLLCSTFSIDPNTLFGWSA